MSGRRDFFWGWVIAGVVAVFCVGIGWFFTLRAGVFVGDDFYYRKSESLYRHDEGNYVELVSDSEIRIVYAGEESRAALAEDGSGWINILYSWCFGCGISG